MTRPHGRAAYLLTLVADAVGAGAVLLVALRPWQTVTTVRAAPLPNDVLHVAGRTVDAAPTALALVALTGVVAVIATRGIARRAVGVVLAVAGAAIVWRSVTGASAVGVARARALVTAHHRTVVVTAARPHVSVTSVWPVLSVFGGVLVLAAGVLVAWRGQRWLTMSARYESTAARPVDADADEVTRQRAAATLWSALDRGDDPTAPAESTDSTAPRDA